MFLPDSEATFLRSMLKEKESILNFQLKQFKESIKKEREERVRKHLMSELQNIEDKKKLLVSIRKRISKEIS
jgi:hypothetical protein